MNVIEVFLLFLAAISVVAVFAQRFFLPAPVCFIFGGMLLAWVPGVENFKIPNELMLLIFLPPLLMESAYFTSFRDFKRNLRPILQLAIGLVIVTSVVTAWVFKTVVPGGTWITGLVLGAIISPPDAVAATAIMRHVKMPKRLQSILEGESLVNDATGLVLYKFAVAAVFAHEYNMSDLSLEFLWKIVAGIALGISLGAVYIRLFKYIGEPSVEILSTIILPFIAYLLAESVHGSGVLGVVATGLTVGWHAPTKFSASFRISAEAVWRMLVFILNGVVFILIGLKVPSLIEGLSQYNFAHLMAWLFWVSFAAIFTRVLWVYAQAYGSRLIPWVRRNEPPPTWQNVFIIAWTGMRGVVSLATALALPLTQIDNSPFPHRDLIIFLATGVILITIVLQGLSLPWIIRKLSVTYDLGILHEDWLARKQAVDLVLLRLEKMREEATVPSAALERIYSHYKDRLESLGQGPNTPLRASEAPSSKNHPLLQAENNIWQEVLDIEHNTVVDLRRKFKVGDDVMNNIMRDIDLMRSRFSD